MRKTPLLTLFLVMLLAGLTSATAGEKPAGPAAPDPAAAPAVLAPTYEPMTVMGMKVWIDPETSQMRPPTPEEAAQMSAQLESLFRPSRRNDRRSAAPSTTSRTRRHANGMLSMQLDTRFLDFSVARVGTDGKIHLDCVDDIDHATTLATKPVAEPEEE